MAESHRQEIITALLEWYVDVLNGVRDGVGDDPIHLPLRCRAYNSPAYRELERLLPLLAEAEPNRYWNVAERYWRARTRRVLRCPRCMRLRTVHRPRTRTGTCGCTSTDRRTTSSSRRSCPCSTSGSRQSESSAASPGWRRTGRASSQCSRASSSGRSRRGTLSRHGEVAVHALGLACVEALEASAPRQARPTLTAGSKTPRFPVPQTCPRRRHSASDASRMGTSLKSAQRL